MATAVGIGVREGNSGTGGGNLSELYQNSRRLLLKSRDGLEKVERFEYTSSSSYLQSLSSSSSAPMADPSEQSFDAVRNDIAQIQFLCSEMEILWRSISAKSQRDLWKRKVEQVAEEADSLKASLDKYNLRHQRRMQEARERAELIGRTNGDSSHVLRIFDDEAQAMQSARRSSRMMEETLATGVAILSKYSEQRDRLKRAQRKAFDVLNTLGLSNSVMRLIEKRNRVDRWIKYAGMVLTIAILIFIWRWTR
ncbi:Membrin-12 [Capsicum chinense]|nr:Membrin-12 [Capsicum chinense]